MSVLSYSLVRILLDIGKMVDNFFSEKKYVFIGFKQMCLTECFKQGPSKHSVRRISLNPLSTFFFLKKNIDHFSNV